MISLFEPTFAGNELDYLKKCIESGWVSTAGGFIEKFETNFAKYTGAKYAIACVNGTSALHTSLILSGVGKGDEVIVPTLTFIAPINSIKYVGADPIFMDTDNFYNINISKTISFLLNKTYYYKKR